MGKFSLLRGTDKASWPKIRSSSCALNQGPTCALHTLFPLCLSAALSSFREQPFWVNLNIHVFFLVQPERCFHIIMCHVYLHSWNGKTQNNSGFIELLLLFFFTKPPSSITLTQAMYEDFSLQPSPCPQILHLSK